MTPEETLKKHNVRWRTPTMNARYVRWEAALAAINDYANQQKLNIASVSGSASGAVGKGVRVGSEYNYFCVKRMHKEPVCLKQCEWCKKA
jgi:hypothetical protein